MLVRLVAMRLSIAGPATLNKVTRACRSLFAPADPSGRGGACGSVTSRCYFPAATNGNTTGSANIATTRNTTATGSPART